MSSIRKLLSIQFLITLFLLPSRRNIINGFGINLIKVPDDDLSQVICSMALLRKYYISGEPLSGSVLYISLTKASMHTQKKLLEAMHGMIDYPWSIVIRDPKNSKTNAVANVVLHEKPQCYFLIIENIEDEDLDDIFEDWKTTNNWNPLAQYVVYLSSVEETDEEMTELMIEILLSFMNKKIFNVNVIGQSEENGYYYGKTAFPYHPDNNCGNRVIAIEIIDVCDFRVGEKTENTDEDDDKDFGENDGNDNSTEKNSDEGGGEDENGDNNDNQNNDNGDNFGDEQNTDNDMNEEVGENNNRNNEQEVDENRNQNQDENEVENYKDDIDGSNALNSYEDLNPNANDFNKASIKGEKLELQIKSHDRKRNKKNKNTEENNKIHTEKKKNRRKSIRNGMYSKLGKIKSFKIKINQNKINFKHKKDKSTSHHGLIPRNFVKSFSPIIGKSERSFPEQRTLQMDDFYYNQQNLLKSMGLDYNPNWHDAGDNDTLEQTNNEQYFFFEEIFRALFLDKFPKDLSGCPLAAAYRPWEPYIFREIMEPSLNYPNENRSSIKDDKDYVTDSIFYDDSDPNFQLDMNSIKPTEDSMSKEQNSNIHLSGIEYQLLQIIGKHLHINIELHVENMNLYHLFQELIDGDVEMLIGGIDEDPSMSQYVSTTIPYHQDDLTWCVAKATRSYSLFNFLASFSTIVWLAILLYIIVASITVTWMNRILNYPIWHFRRVLSAVFRIYGSVFNQSIPINITHRPLRLVFLSTFSLGLIFMNAYQSFLISTLTTPESAYQIKKIEEIYQNRMIIKGSVDNVRHLNKEGEIFKYIRENFQMCYNIEECLIEAAENEKVAVAVSRQHSFYNPRIPRNRLYCFDRNENIYIYLVTMLLPKKFHLLHKINPVIQHVIESGHMQKWARDLDMRRKIREERNRIYEDTFHSLTLGQVIGTFVFAGALLCIAFMALILEICVYRLATKRSRRRLKIVTYLHRRLLRA